MTVVAENRGNHIMIMGLFDMIGRSWLECAAKMSSGLIRGCIATSLSVELVSHDRMHRYIGRFGGNLRMHISFLELLVP